MEKARCTSEFLFTVSGVSFVPAAQKKEISDYIFEPPEDLHLKAIVGTFLLSDLYRTRKLYQYNVIRLSCVISIFVPSAHLRRKLV